MDRQLRSLRKNVLKAALPMLKLWPPRSAVWAVGQIGRLEYLLLPGVRSAYDQAVERSARRLGEDWPIRPVSRQLVMNQVRARARDLLIDGRSDAQLKRVFRVEGREHLDDAVAERRGIVLMGNHFGSNMLMAFWMLRQGYPWRMFAERPRNVSKLLAELFETDGPLGQRGLFISRKANPAEAAGAILRATRVLRSGIVLSIAADVRWNGPLTAPGRFLGRTHTFSSTWVTLAALSGAPVVPAFCAIAPDGTYRIEFEPSFQIPREAREGPEMARWVQHGLDLIEERVRRDPANSIDYFFWEDPDEIAPRENPAALDLVAG